MKDFAGRGAFVSGGASGIGLGIALALARAGARVVIADIRDDHLDAAVARAAAEGQRLVPMRLDVADRAAHAAVADAAERAVGPITVLSLNAGVGILGSLLDASEADWDWIMGVNVGGAVNGLCTFVPRIRAHRQGGSIMATSSMGGVVVANTGGIYSASKRAVVSMLGCLREDLAGEGIGVSVLCPGVVNTNIHQHYAMRPAGLGTSGYVKTEQETSALKQMLETGLSPDTVGDLVLEGLRADRAFITPHAAKSLVQQRRDALLASLGAGRAQP